MKDERLLELVEYLASGLTSFLNDPPDTDLQRGYRDAQEEMLRVSASWAGVPYNPTEAIGTVLHKLLKQFPKNTLRQQALLYLAANRPAAQAASCSRYDSRQNT